MLKRSLILSFVMSAPLLFGQLDSNSVTVTASRNVNLQPDQVLFSISVSTPLTASLDDVLAALKSAGITIVNFSGVSSSTTGTIACIGTGTTPFVPTEQWAFRLPVALGQMKATVTTLTSLQQSITQGNNGFTLYFAVQGTQVSTSLLQSQTCSITGLIADATAQAQKLASAAGLSLGPILAMSNAQNLPLVTSVSAEPFGSFVSGTLAQPQGCELTVKFALTRF